MRLNLTDTTIKNAKPKNKAYKLTDGGLLYIPQSGGKLWRLKYRFEGKIKLLSFDAYPAVSLRDARQKRDEAKEILPRILLTQAHIKRPSRKLCALKLKIP